MPWQTWWRTPWRNRTSSRCDNPAASLLFRLRGRARSACLQTYWQWRWRGTISPSLVRRSGWAWACSPWRARWARGRFRPWYGWSRAPSARWDSPWCPAEHLSPQSRWRDSPVKAVAGRWLAWWARRAPCPVCPGRPIRPAWWRQVSPQRRGWRTESRRRAFPTPGWRGRSARRRKAWARRLPARRPPRRKWRRKRQICT